MTNASVSPATPSTSRMVDINALALNVTFYEGNGPRVLLIHGIASSGREFDPVIDHLTDVMSPVTVDMRGHGASDRPDTGYHYDDYARDLQHLIETLDMEQPIILGHSLGGITTIWWATQHPTTPKALIIEDSPLRSGEEFQPAFDGWEQLNRMSFEEVKAHYRSERPDLPEQLVETHAWDMTHTKPEVISELRAASLSNQGLDSLGNMQDITAPVLFIHGDPDTGSMVHPADLAALPSRLPNVRIARIPGGGHSMHRNRIPEWLALVKGFMRDLA